MSTQRRPSSVVFHELTPQWQENRKVVSEAKFRYLSWDYFDKSSSFLRCQDLAREFPQCLKKWERKTNIVFIAHRWVDSTQPDPENQMWESLRDSRASLSNEFDGFFYDYSCLSQSPRTADEETVYQTQIKCIPAFIYTCHLYVANPLDDEKVGFLRRGWLCYELLSAIRNQRLVLNENVILFLKQYPDMIGENMTGEFVQKMMKNTEFSSPENKETVECLVEEQFFLSEAAFEEKKKEDLEHQPQSQNPHQKNYVLLPVQDVLDREKKWEDMKAVMLEHVDPERVLMISHPWKTKDHPDPKYEDLHIIRQHLCDHPGRYDYLFFDYACIGQEEFEINDLMKVDLLYASSPCLCLCHDNYFHRAWCLFEIMVNNFNRGNPIVRGSRSTDDSQLQEWMELARLAQQLGYINTLQQSSFTIGDIELNIPRNQLELKALLLQLLMTSRLTNNGDRRFILNLLDHLI